MKKTIIVLAAILLSSCTQRGCQRWKRQQQYSSRAYGVYMYSGGKMIFEDHFKGIINQEQHSDGIYYFKGDTLVEVNGDYIIKSED